MSKKTDLENIKRIVEEEAIEVFVEYNAQFEFHHFCNDLKTVFVHELPETEVEVDFKMTKNLEKKLKELSKRYTVGIFYQSKK
tara:strand:+ start:732 stop:980 length:249 start_codon:yes stop_codon:yes gene_type:complete